MNRVRITMLNSMADADFDKSLKKQGEWGIRLLDLKDCIYGKSISDLSYEEAERVRDKVAEMGMSVYCLSTTLFSSDIEQGEDAFRRRHMDGVKRIIEVAKVIKPSVIRLLAAESGRRHELENMIPHIKKEHPWLFKAYREAVDAISSAGFMTTIENEVGNCIFSTPDEIKEFFYELDRPGKLFFTYDVQNLWEMGTFPTLEVYEKLSGLIGYFHIKGGQTRKDGTAAQAKGEAGIEADAESTESNALYWRSSLEDASWPVVEMTRRVIDSGRVPVICLNSPHGKSREGYDYGNLTKRDLDFMRANFPEIE